MHVSIVIFFSRYVEDWSQIVIKLSISLNCI